MSELGSTRSLFRELGLPPGDARDLQDSPYRFPDGAQYRVEIPSVEGPRCLEAVLDAAKSLNVTVHRVSQGSGSSLHTSDELNSMAIIAEAAGVEVSLFARPSASWDISAATRSSAGSVMAGVARGQDQVLYALDDILRAAAHGFRSVLISDIGVLDGFRHTREHGLLPSNMRAKVSVMLPVANPMTARIVEGLGASTINIVTDLTIAQIATIRSAVKVPLDIYVEAPDSLGGFVRLYEIAELVRVAAPVYLKFGLRNAPDVYPSGSHLEDLAVRLSIERVRRARLGLELLATSMPGAIGSMERPIDLAVPESGRTRRPAATAPAS